MNKTLLVVLGFVLFLVLVIWASISVYFDWMWFENLGFSPVFWTMVVSKFGFGSLIWLLAMVMIVINLVIARRLHKENQPSAVSALTDEFAAQLGLSEKTLNALLVALVLFVSFFIASKGSLEWDMLMRYLHQQPFNSVDPIFENDISFYLFSLPFYFYIRKGLVVLVLLSALVATGWYLKNGALQIEGDFTQEQGAPPSFPKVSISPAALKHLIFLGGIIVLIMSAGYYLRMYGVLYSTQGPAFGASYTDVHIKILALKISTVVSFCFALLLFFSAFKFKIKFIWIGGGIWIGAVLFLTTGLPILVQQFVVKPNELAKESPYIAHNIEFTRNAYNLNKIKEVDFEVNDQLSMEDLKKHDVTIQNIRIWDERPLLQTYRQIQTIRLYYNFHNVDVDRYFLNNQYRQLMLATRELVVDQLPPQANTWVNRHLIYTHGYGLAASPVNEVTSEGLPHLYIKDVPPSFEPELKIDRPEIYYGEKTDEYVLIKTKAKEFDYPKGDKNVYTVYQGRGGVPISSFLRRLVFAIELQDPQILFTTYLSPESKIMYKRQIDRRMASIAPFLAYDEDPYVVVSEGRIYWVRDAYTTSDMYPYSVRTHGRFKNKRLNYIRNSVKVTVDAYNGDVAFYLIDETDPIAKTYLKIFPKLFKPFADMPAGLKQHIRYPKDLFEIQVETYSKYHMEDIQVFYNQEDLWQIPDELYGGSRQQMEPYYIIIKLPEEEKEEFLLMIPFTPSRKDNMIGWLAARSDLPNYGNLIVYKLPKEKLVYGPMQIEARVDQQTEISRELSLWGQKGSRVIRGNLLAIPVSDTFIYVEPVYLQAKQEKMETQPAGQTQPRGFSNQQRRGAPASSQQDTSTAAALPELKRVIAAFSNRLGMEDNLDKALRSVLSGQIFTGEIKDSPGARQDQTITELGVLALEHYNAAKAHLRDGRWADYGRELENLEKVLTRISNRTEE